MRKGNVGSVVILNIIRVLAFFEGVLYFVPIMSIKRSYHQQAQGFLSDLFGWGGQTRQKSFSISLMNLTFGQDFGGGIARMQPRYVCMIFILIPVALFVLSFFIKNEGTFGFVVLVCVIQNCLALFTDKIRLEDGGMAFSYTNWFYAIIGVNSLLAIFALAAFVNSNMK